MAHLAAYKVLAVTNAMSGNKEGAHVDMTPEALVVLSACSCDSHMHGPHKVFQAALDLHIHQKSFRMQQSSIAVPVRDAGTLELAAQR